MHLGKPAKNQGQQTKNFTPQDEKTMGLFTFDCYVPYTQHDHRADNLADRTKI
jgi:hypothetical protein